MSSDFEASWQRRFRQFALDHEDDAGIAGWSEAGLQARLRNFLRIWRPDSPDAMWLDAGCGAGTYARALAHAGQRVVALDYSLPTLTKARKRSGEEIVLWVAGDATRLPLASGSCDGAICFGVLQTLSDPTRAIQELFRIVRPEGVVFVDALNSTSLPHLAKRILRGGRPQQSRLRYDNPRRLKQVFQESGFRDVGVIWVPILPTWLGGLQRLAETRLVRAGLAQFPLLGSALSHAFVVSGNK